MAIWKITHACGHEEEHDIGGPIEDRESRADWLNMTDCTACWKKKKHLEREEQSIAAQREARKAGLPPLRGTPRQIAWGETIRMERMRYAKQMLCQAEAKEFINTEQSDQCLAYLSGREEAKWWIEHREASLAEVIAEQPQAMAIVPGFPKEVQDIVLKRMHAVAEDRMHQDIRDAVETVFGRVVPVKVGRWGDEKRVYVGAFGEGLEYIEKTDRLTDRGGLEYEEAAAMAFCRDLCESFEEFRLKT
jgi:hypothetical protein